MNSSPIVAGVRAAHAALVANASGIESLVRAMGDGDHHLDVRRGCDAVMAVRSDLQSMSPGAALVAIGTALFSAVEGAWGPLISGFFIAMGKSIGDAALPGRRDVAQAFAAGVESVKLHGRADMGEKTMLDVLIPVSRLLLKLSAEAIALEELCAQVNAEATRNMLATRDMMAAKGRAHTLGERAMGHIDPGSKTCEVIIAAVAQAVLSR